jgi:WD40 repeat protein
LDLVSGKPIGLEVIGSNSICWSHDNSTVYVGSTNNAIVAFHLDPKGGEEIGSHKAEINGKSLSSEGRFLISGSKDGSARIWDIASKQSMWEFHTPNNKPVTDVGFTREGKYAYIVAEDIHIFRLDWELEEKSTVDWDSPAMIHMRNFALVYFRDQASKKAILIQQKNPKLDHTALIAVQKYLAEFGFGYLTQQGIEMKLREHVGESIV